MANNIYIGNRYVPVFADPVEWDNLRTYEPLTIVTYQGTSYTSKKAVPVGIALNNTEYWVVTGNYNAYIGELNDRVDDLEDRVDDLEENKKLANLPNRKIIFIGDSYASITTEDNKNMFEIATSILGCQSVILKRAGIGFTNINGQGTFLDLLETITADKDSYTDIVVCGGCNDYSTIALTEAAIKEFCNYAFVNFPNVIISVLHVGGFTDARRASQISLSLPAYRNCGKYGARYINNSEYIMYNGECFANDATHPISAHVPYIGAKIAEGLSYGICNIEIIDGPAPTPIESELFTVDTTYLPPFTTFIHNNIVGFNSGGYQICYLSNISSGAINNHTFEHKILSGLRFYGFPTDWSTGNYALPIVAHINNMTGSYSGFLYANSDGTLSLLVFGIPNDTTSLMIHAIGNCICDFDVLRGGNINN